MTKHSLGMSIAVAEGVSSVASLGAVWMLGRHEHLIDPMRDFIANHIIYPCETCLHSDKAKTPHTGKFDPELMHDAKKKARVLVKGAMLLTAGFASYVPTQMAMEGDCSMHEFKKVIRGNGLGVGSTLASLWLADKIHPGIVEQTEDKMQALMGKPDCPPEEQHAACRRQADFCKMVMLDIPSSVMSGLVNYCFTRSHPH